MYPVVILPMIYANQLANHKKKTLREIKPLGMNFVNSALEKLVIFTFRKIINFE